MKTMNYLRGVSQIEVRGISEDIINRVSQADILLWGVERDENTVKFYIHTKNVHRTLALYPDAVVSGRGVPEKLKKLRHRGAFVCLALLFTCMWLVSGLLIWEFQVVGCVEVDEYDIIRVLRENGVDYGTIGFLVDSEKLSNIVLCEIPELSWFAINISGSRALVSVRERVPVPEVADPNEQCGVYASKSGLVTKAQVYDGTKIVSVGQEVEEGDLLVSGITASVTGVRTEHALARIEAQTYYEFTAEMPKKCSFKSMTGQEKVHCAIDICGRVFGLYFKNDTGNYERYEERRGLEIMGASLPVSLVITRFCGYELCEGELTREECANILKDELSLKLRLENTGDILWSEFEVTESEDTVTVTLRARCLERIG